MQKRMSQRVVGSVLCLAILLLGIAVYVLKSTSQEVETTLPLEPEVVHTPSAVVRPEKAVIGTSVEGRDIEAYTYGNGLKHLLFVGGIHGGYEWNSVVLAYKFIEYLKENPDVIPANLTVTVIPSANPDGVYAVIGKEGKFTEDDVPETTGAVGTSRFNAHNVDLNRNFDCKWKSESMWRGEVVSAGTKAFSEPEAVAIRDYVLAYNTVGVIFWHSQSNAVYASECTEGILPTTRILMDIYAQSAGYPAVPVFDAYEITGDAEGWLASINIPAITVELKTHETIEWEKNLRGIKAVLEYYK